MEEKDPMGHEQERRDYADAQRDREDEIARERTYAQVRAELAGNNGSLPYGEESDPEAFEMAFQAAMIDVDHDRRLWLHPDAKPYDEGHYEMTGSERVRSWKPEVRTGSDPKWYGNALRFATEREALDNVANLAGRWLLVTDTRATPSPDPVTHRWVDGALEEA